MAAPTGARMVREEALEGRRGPGAGEVGRYSYPGEARPGVRQSTPRKAKDGWAETLSRRLQGPGRQNWRWAGVKERWCESAIRPEEPKRSQGGVGGYLGVANLVTKGEEGVTKANYQITPTAQIHLSPQLLRTGS